MPTAPQAGHPIAPKPFPVELGQRLGLREAQHAELPAYQTIEHDGVQLGDTGIRRPQRSQQIEEGEVAFVRRFVQFQQFG